MCVRFETFDKTRDKKEERHSEGKLSVQTDLPVDKVFRNRQVTLGFCLDFVSCLLKMSSSFGTSVISLLEFGTSVLWRLVLRGAPKCTRQVLVRRSINWHRLCSFKLPSTVLKMRRASSQNGVRRLVPLGGLRSVRRHARPLRGDRRLGGRVGRRPENHRQVPHGQQEPQLLPSTSCRLQNGVGRWCPMWACSKLRVTSRQTRDHLSTKWSVQLRNQV